jgi:Cd2+/Zn2+-exporting ATPase
MSDSIQFRIQGMDCAEEVALLKAEIGPLVGGPDRLQFDILNAKMTVIASDASADWQRIVDSVAKLGMRAEIWSDAASLKQGGSTWLAYRYAALSAASGLSVASGFAIHALTAGLREALGSEISRTETVLLAPRLAYLVGIVCGLWAVLPKAWIALKRLRPDMNLLMTIAVAGAIGVGEWFEAAMVAFLFSLSLALESWSVGKARRAVESLLAIAPNLARVRIASGEIVERSSSEVAVGSSVLVSPGERIPLDGEVVQGSSHVNQAPITGESVPVAKTKGSSVFAGTINGDGSLEIRTTKPASETTLAHIIRLVGDAQSKRAPSEQWVERFAQIYTPAVMLTALTIAVGPPLVFGNWQGWFYRSLVLLVIACPCALVISTPVTIVAALAAAAKNGILIKGGLHVETPGRLRLFAFDKTGTLTEGKPRVSAIVPMNGHDELELLERAASLETHSDHPLAKAIMDYSAALGVPALPADDFRIIPGKGAVGTFREREFWLGSHRLLEEKQMETPEIHAKLLELSGAGRSVVVVGNDQHVCGFMAISDSVRSEAKSIVAKLKQAGIDRVVMLSGDNSATAQAVGNEIGADEVFGELLPADKVATIERLSEQYGTIGMVGDGVNDAPALARADVGIAMGAIGTDAAIETADIALMSDDLEKLPWLIRLSRQTLGIIRQNIAFALVVKVTFVLLTALGLASMWGAIAADTGASLVVIANGLRLLKA